jgi:glycerate 2-kinase
MTSPRALTDELVSLFGDVAAACDGQALVAAALGDLGAAAARDGRTLHVLALGKAAAPMLDGFLESWPRIASAGPVGDGLIIAPGPRAHPGPRDGFTQVLGEHPTPGAGSVRAGAAARAFVAAMPPDHRLIVLLSGGGSALACLPADGLALEDKLAAVSAVAAAGAPIGELNCVRKHLSAIKGGQLAQLARGPVLVLALSDVIGNDPATIASGPFSPDPTSHADALAVLDARAGGRPLDPLRSSHLAAARAHLQAGARGLRPETPKPGPAFDDVAHHVIADPGHVAAAAGRAAQVRGWRTEALWRDTTLTVEALAGYVLAQAERLASAGLAPGVTAAAIGNGEPTIDLTAASPPLGTGGRATHLALLVARGLADLARRHPRTSLAFLAAGTDDRDGSSDASGAVVDGDTWAQAAALGLDAQAALEHADSATLLAARGALVRGPCTSNLLDLHVLAARGR